MLNQKLPRGIYLLFLLNANNGEPVKGKTRLEKLMFLISKEILDKPGRRITLRDYTFRADKFGPFTEEVYDDAETLNEIGLAKWTDDMETIQITDRGVSLINNIKNKLNIPHSLIIDIERLKRKYNNIKLKELLTYVYKNYEEYTYESEIKGQILGK